MKALEPAIRADAELLCDIEMDLLAGLQYQLGLALEYLHREFGLRETDISIIDGVRLRILV